jgi:predicted AAA+ superfamily ATPase
MYLKRHIDSDLLAWKDSKIRKPLLLRGARQVGKLSSVRELAKSFDNLVEINFEHRDFQAAQEIFARHSSPRLICEELATVFGVKIVKGQTLLFLDEIQNCIPAISTLRYFYEEMPDLHVIAAGSMQSLFLFLKEKKRQYGIRSSLENFGTFDNVMIYPLYAVSNIIKSSMS